MFTHVVDDAINRVELEGGEVAVTYDLAATNLLEDMGIKGIAIARSGSGYTEHDPSGLFRLYDGAQEDKAMALDDIEYYVRRLRYEYGPQWWEVVSGVEDEIRWVLQAMDVVEESDETLKGMISFTYTENDCYGAPQFQVVIDPAVFQESWGPTDVEWEAIYRLAAREYALWAEGEVFLIGYEDKEGHTEYLGNVVDIDPYDDNALVEFAKSNF